MLVPAAQCDPAWLFSLTFLTHAVIVAFVVEATVVRFALMLSQVTARTLKEDKEITNKENTL